MINAGNYRFTSSGSKIVFPGFLSVYQNDEDKAENNAALHKVAKGDVFKEVELKKEQHFTQPPAHYTEASLVKELEDLGIGRPSTYAPTISTLISRRYLAKENKNLYLSDLGDIVNRIMVSAFPSIVDVNFTATMETLLDGVAEGTVEWKSIIRNFYPDLKEAVEHAEQALEKIEIEDEVTDTICEKDIEDVLQAIRKAEKPMIFVGGGCILSGASAELKEFVKKVDAPVTDTLMGKGAFDGTDEYYTGMLGMHGTKTANLSVTECDLLLALGVRFSDRVTGNAKKFATNAKIVHIDIDAAEINKNIQVDYSIVGDLKAVLEILNKKLENQYHKAWIDKVLARKAALPMTYREDVLTGPYVIERINEATQGDAIITTDVGQHQMWAAQYYQYKNPRSFLSSGGMGTMGYGLGACIGAKVGNPDKTVFNIAGDGCFRMNMNELATASRYDIPIIQVVFDNHALGMVRQWQTLFYGKRYSSTILQDKVDYVKVSEALGAKAFLVTKREEVDDVLKQAMQEKGPVVICCVLDQDDKVWPMVAPGEAIEKAFTEEDLKKSES